MTVVHFVRKCLNVPPDQLAGGAEIRLFDPEEHQGLVRHLAQAMPAGSEPSPTPDGLLAELTSRPGRTVEAWLAISSGAAGPEPLGLAILVTGSGDVGRRYSISWLIIHPAAQRRGIGRRLVDEASRRALALGATGVSVECHSAWAAAVAFWRALGFEESASRPLTRRDARSTG